MGTAQLRQRPMTGKTRCISVIASSDCTIMLAVMDAFAYGLADPEWFNFMDA